MDLLLAARRVGPGGHAMGLSCRSRSVRVRRIHSSSRARCRAAAIAQHPHPSNAVQSWRERRSATFSTVSSVSRRSEIGHVLPKNWTRARAGTSAATGVSPRSYASGC
ncbi:hypothetical protein [Paraburkholderia sediminicola]|uniref:hypothetical protein n=1 Tax=Paraburkholderia sediminicola TaxID=458836 RepID=UPI0038BB3825